jgi:DNA-binding MarR family transcriptional regulator
VAALDELIHQPVRLRIMAALVTLQSGRIEFTSLRNLLELTDGNLGAHLKKLEEAEYVEVTKEFVARKPRTYVAASDAGRQAFADHVAALAEVLSGPPVPPAEEEEEEAS